MSGFDMGKALTEMNLIPQKETGHHFWFLSYAIEQCLFHVSHTSKDPGHIDLLLQLLDSKSPILEVGSAGLNLLLRVCEYDHQEILRVLSQYPGIDLNLQDKNGRTPLHVAALFGNKNAVEQLLRHSAVDANIKDNEGGTPLIAAIRFGQEAVCKALIKSEKVPIIEPNPKTDQTPLHIAALHSSAAWTVEMLLQREETLPSVRHRGNRTALQRAYEINNTPVVRVMLESHRVDAILEPWGPGDDAVSLFVVVYGTTDINLKAPDHDMSLQNSLNRREDEMAMVIIESKRLDVNLQDRHGDTPLRLAAQYKSEGIALRLLEIDSIDINIQNASGNTALHTAAEDDQVNVVRRMLEREELNANHQDKVGITPLHLAFRYNQHLVAKLLLDCQKVNPNVEDLSGQRPLEYSALRKSTQIIRLIFNSENIGPLSRDFNLNQTNSDGQYLLQRVIACKPMPEIMWLLLMISDFDATHTDSYGRTALHTAVMYGYGIGILLDTEKFDHALQCKDRNGLTPQDLTEKLGGPQIIRARSASKNFKMAYRRLGHRLEERVKA